MDIKNIQQPQAQPQPQSQPQSQPQPQPQPQPYIEIPQPQPPQKDTAEISALKELLEEERKKTADLSTEVAELKKANYKLIEHMSVEKPTKSACDTLNEMFK